MARCHDEVDIKNTLLEAINKCDLPGGAEDKRYENVQIIGDPDTLYIDM